MKTIIDKNLDPNYSPVFFLSSKTFKALADWPSEYAPIAGLVPWYNRGWFGRLKRWWHHYRMGY